MIDEKKLIEELEKLKEETHTPVDIVWNSLLKICIDIVKEQPKVGEWIPSSEMLPSIDMSYPNANDYLVYYEHGCYDTASYSNINRFWNEYTTKPYWNCAQYCEVVAWMPLPPAFKGE